MRIAIAGGGAGSTASGVNKGDTITLIGKADGSERARLDYIEFIPPAK